MAEGLGKYVYFNFNPLQIVPFGRLNPMTMMTLLETMLKVFDWHCWLDIVNACFCIGSHKITSFMRLVPIIDVLNQWNALYMKHCAFVVHVWVYAHACVYTWLSLPRVRITNMPHRYRCFPFQQIFIQAQILLRWTEAIYMERPGIVFKQVYSLRKKYTMKRTSFLFRLQVKEKRWC